MWPGIRGLPHEEAGIPGVLPQELLLEVVPHLVGRLANAGADRGLDALPAGTERLHGRQRRLQNPAPDAPPARMRGTDHPGLAVARPRAAVTMASARGRSSTLQGFSTMTAVALWT
jgi:hypothetical protein